ncbi:protein of unknown function DUF490 [Marinithermus hydrothermalis DSM 14884]|uniref:Translocation and assembly module TamB C-terminal domain-containing protein n=1 Tax=Marinithermus hydrothermalis (strain DSM 14884 / JCM 11576 / T1) TaxID=869210 RepID=F2NLI8_MARHT|nr:protein of unknown function DUF490 [Marinithermus hydrothermalis DSM 14884]
MRFRRLLFLLFLLVLSLPGFPPLLEWGLNRGAAMLGWEAHWSRVRGYALTGLTFEDLRVTAPGFTLEADRLSLSYSLLSLLGRALPLEVRLGSGVVSLDWDELVAPQPDAAPLPLTLHLTSLSLDRLEVHLRQGRAYALPPVHLNLWSEGSRYRFTAALPDGKVEGGLRLKGLASLELQASGDLRVFRYWWDGVQQGRFRGEWRFERGAWSGQTRIEDGALQVAGFPVESVTGEVHYAEGRFKADLSGTSLDGPVRGVGEVDLQTPRYTFRVEGTPRLEALARLYGVRLPVHGEGPLVLEGEGWETLHLNGAFQGTGRFSGYPIEYTGVLEFAPEFRLVTRLQGAWVDRTYTVDFTWTQGYVARATDSLGSTFVLEGEGVRTRGHGTLVWPRPLDGQAEVRWTGEADRYRVEVSAPGVRLPLGGMVDLTGTLQGRGDTVTGRLGPLRVAGRWSDLELALDPLPLAVGALQGTGRFTDHLEAELQYTSDYLSLPLNVVQEGSVWYVRAPPYAQATYRDGTLDVTLQDLPVRFGEVFYLSGQARYRNGWSGELSAVSRSVELAGVLEGHGARFSGQMRTPLGRLPLTGQVTMNGLQLQTGELQLEWAGGRARLKGRTAIGALTVNADLEYTAQGFSGSAALDSPWVSAVLKGVEGRLEVTTAGYAELVGTLWPEVRLLGTLRPPDRLYLALTPLDVEVRAGEARVGTGWVRWTEGAPRFQLDLPFTVWGRPARLEAEGGLTEGRVVVEGEGLHLEGAGPWEALPLAGRVELPRLGGVTVEGRANLPALEYALTVRPEAFAGEVRLEGQGLALRYAGTLHSNGALTLSGTETSARLEAKGFDLTPIGLPLTLEGTLRQNGVLEADLRAISPYGTLQAKGSGAARLTLESPWGQGEGYWTGSTLELRAVLEHPWVAGTLELAGPLTALRVTGKGTYRLPLLESAAWQLEADLSSQVWALRGPLELEGEGLTYQGQVRWAYRLAGRAGVLEGRLQGQAARAVLEAQSDLAGLPLTLRAAYADGLRAELTLPQGALRYAGGDLEVVALDLAPLAAALGLDVSGVMRGRLSEEIQGTLKVYGRPVTLRAFMAEGYPVVEVWDAALEAGLAVYFARPWRVEGRGALAGQATLGEAWAGGLRLARGEVQAELTLDGTWRDPRLTLVGQGYGVQASAEMRGVTVHLTAQGRGVQLSAQGAWDTARYQGEVRYTAPLFSGLLQFSGTGLRYEGSGYLVSHAYLKQAGPLRLSGEGTAWRLTWSGPVQITARGAPRLAALEVRGLGTVEVPGAGALRFNGDLTYNGRFSGEAELEGPDTALMLQGLGERLRAEGTLRGAQLQLGVRSDLSLEGYLTYAGGWGGRRLALEAAASGSLNAPRVEGTGRLEGQGAVLVLTFGYDHGFWGRLEGEGVTARLDRGSLTVTADDWDLAPFVGAPLVLEARGEGAWETFVLPLEVRGPGLALKGEARLQPTRLELSGTVRRGAVRFSADAEGVNLTLDLPDPEVRGGVAWQPGVGFSGALQLSLALPGGGVAGTVDLDQGHARLEGYGAWRGTLELGLDGAPTLQANLAGPYGTAEGWLQFGAAYQGRMDLEIAGWGGVRLEGGEAGLTLQGTGGLAPLTAELRKDPLRLDWRYVGDLPRGWGALDATGTWPGAWLEGVYRYADRQVTLHGEGDRLVLKGEGLEGEVRREGLDLRLEGFGLGPLALNGTLQGAWRAVQVALDWQAGGMSGAVRGGYDGALQLELTGDVAGTLRYDTAWRGEVVVPGGRLTVEGRGAPVLEGRVYGVPVRLSASALALGGLRVDWRARTAAGSWRYAGISFTGAGSEIRATYPVGPGRLEGRFSLKDLSLTVTPEGIGSGALRYRNGVAGAVTLELYGFQARMEGEGNGIRLTGQHEVAVGLPWKTASLEGWLGLDGTWRFAYRADGVQLEGEGQRLEGRLRFESPWGNGSLQRDKRWTGALELAEFPIRGLGATATVSLRVEDGRLKGSGRVRGELGEATFTVGGVLDGYALREARLEADAAAIRVEALPGVARILPHVAGRMDGTLAYAQGRWSGRLVSREVRIAGEAVPLTMRFSWGGSEGTAEVQLGESRFTIGLTHGVLSVKGQWVRFPLHLALAAWAGPVEGQAFWTGAVRLELPLADPRRATVVAAGEQVRLVGGGNELVGQAVLRFVDGTLFVERLDIQGTGSWQGHGYWSPRDADLELVLRDTVFTPVLRLIPGMNRYAPSASGTVTVRAKGRTTEVALEGLRFALGPVSGSFAQGRITYDGDRLQAQGEATLAQPYPVRARLSAEGTLQAFEARGAGEATLPGVGRLTNLEARLVYPDLELTVQSSTAALEGRLSPLALRLVGRLPVTYPQGYLREGWVEADLTLRAQDGVYRLGGAVEVQRAVLAFPEERREVVFREGRSALPLVFDRVRIQAEGGVILQETLAQGELGGQVFLAGSAANPFLSGEVRALRGSFFLGEHRFEVTEGTLRFSPSDGLFPEVNLTARTRLAVDGRPITVFLSAEGRFVREDGSRRLVLEPHLRSDPPYDERVLYALLTLGTTRLAEVPIELTQGALSAAVESLVIGQLERELARALGLDVLRVEAPVLTGGDLAETRFTIGKYLSPDLFLGYRVDLQGNQLVSLEYRAEGARFVAEGDVSRSPRLNFSVSYALERDVDLFFQIEGANEVEGSEVSFGFEWRF